jgi:hypothetical protein
MAVSAEPDQEIGAIDVMQGIPIGNFFFNRELFYLTHMPIYCGLKNWANTKAPRTSLCTITFLALAGNPKTP